VFKDMSYQSLPPNKYQRIAVMCAPNKWRADLINPSVEKKTTSDGQDAPLDIYHLKTTYKNKADYVALAKALSNALETALYFGYDSVVLDDRALEDNQAPAHQTAKMIKDVIQQFNGRFREITIAINRSASFKVFRHYFSC
jgi:hypothetical protein